jgi:gluconate 2-dehydrogenase gamma chain
MGIGLTQDNRRKREEISMSQHDEARRAFLLRTAVGAGAAAGAALVPDAFAQSPAPATPAAIPVVDHAHAAGGGYGTFLNAEYAATVEAFTERLMPGAPGMAGARDAGVRNYIDLALAGAYSDMQDFYRRGLAALDGYCRATHGQPFVQLTAAKQDDVLKAMDEGKATGFTWPSAQAFFNTLRTHTIEGMFADPVYGGNKDFAGWRLVGFPGAQPVFSAADMLSKDAFKGGVLIGLQAQVPARRT